MKFIQDFGIFLTRIFQDFLILFLLFRSHIKALSWEIEWENGDKMFEFLNRGGSEKPNRNSNSDSERQRDISSVFYAWRPLIIIGTFSSIETFLFNI